MNDDQQPNHINKSTIDPTNFNSTIPPTIGTATVLEAGNKRQQVAADIENQQRENQDSSLNKKKIKNEGQRNSVKLEIDPDGVTPTMYVKQKFDGDNIRPNLHHQYMPVDQTLEDNLAGLNQAKTTSNDIEPEANAEDDDDDDSDEDMNQPMEMRCPHCGTFGLTKVVKVCTCKTIMIWILTVFLFILCSCCICLFQPMEDGESTFTDYLACKCLMRPIKHQCRSCHKYIAIEYPDRETIFSTRKSQVGKRSQLSGRDSKYSRPSLLKGGSLFGKKQPIAEKKTKFIRDD